MTRAEGMGVPGLMSWLPFTRPVYNLTFLHTNDARIQGALPVTGLFLVVRKVKLQHLLQEARVGHEDWPVGVCCTFSAGTQVTGPGSTNMG